MIDKYSVCMYMVFKLRLIKESGINLNYETMYKLVQLERQGSFFLKDASESVFGDKFNLVNTELDKLVFIFIRYLN